MNSLEELDGAWTRYVENYSSYFEGHSSNLETKLTMLDPYPRIILVPGMGMLVAGKNTKEVGIAKDLYLQTMETILKAEGVGTYEALSSKDIFDVEYWVLEQAN